MASKLVRMFCTSLEVSPLHCWPHHLIILLSTAETLELHYYKLWCSVYMCVRACECDQKCICGTTYTINVIYTDLVYDDMYNTLWSLAGQVYIFWHVTGDSIARLRRLVYGKLLIIIPTINEIALCYI